MKILINLKYYQIFIKIDNKKITKKAFYMRIVQKIIRNLENILDYYNQTEDTNDLVSDIREIIVSLQLGTLE